jgi:hypothetical protein
VGFFDSLTGVVAVLQREGRVTYRALAQEFGSDAPSLDGLGRELVFGQVVSLTKPRRTDYIGTSVDAFLPWRAGGMAVQWPKVACHGRNPIPYRR